MDGYVDRDLSPWREANEILTEQVRISGEMIELLERELGILDAVVTSIRRIHPDYPDLDV